MSSEAIEVRLLSAADTAVLEVGVSQRVQGQGIGKRLMRALLEQGRIIGCSEAWVATEVNNQAARALYASLAGVEDQDLAVVYTWPLGSGREGAKER